MNQIDLAIRRNTALTSAVADHLRACDKSFVPPLSQRVAVGAYVDKIVERAERFEAWSDDTLVGLLAAYCNDPVRRAAFVTSVSVLPTHRGRGVASSLLGCCIDHVGALGFGCLELEVSRQNTTAMLFYRKHGFALVASDGLTQTLRLYLLN